MKIGNCSLDELARRQPGARMFEGHAHLLSFNLVALVNRSAVGSELRFAVVLRDVPIEDGRLGATGAPPQKPGPLPTVVRPLLWAVYGPSRRRRCSARRLRRVVR